MTSCGKTIFKRPSKRVNTQNPTKTSCAQGEICTVTIDNTAPIQVSFTVAKITAETTYTLYEYDNQGNRKNFVETITCGTTLCSAKFTTTPQFVETNNGANLKITVNFPNDQLSNGDTIRVFNN